MPGMPIWQGGLSPIRRKVGGALPLRNANPLKNKPFAGSVPAELRSPVAEEMDIWREVKLPVNDVAIILIVPSPSCALLHA